MEELQKTIDDAFERRADITPRNAEPQVKDAVMAVIDLLDHHSPGLRSSVIAGALLTPVDIEREYRVTGGHWHHAELAFDQFFMLRPVPGAAQYRTPLPGLYLCGAGADPGGCVMGRACGLAAVLVLAQLA